MSGFWYITAIAATTGALISTVNSTQFPPVRSENQTFTSVTEAVTEKVGTQPSAKTSTRTSRSTDRQNTRRQHTRHQHTNRHYARAMELANQAVVAYQGAQAESEDEVRKLALTQRERFLWQATLQKLKSVPTGADSYDQAQLKIEQYQGLLNTAERKLDTDDNAFLRSIIQAAAIDPQQVHITLCKIDGFQGMLQDSGCSHHQGDQLMASPASLIKLPIAIALMDKSDREGIPLSQKIYIDPQNFTENAEGASVEINREYTLDQVMTRMINESNNIATNQLIDYVGRESIAKTLADRGYRNTLVDHKLAGDRILPPNPGILSNQSTTNELTAMMAQLYGLKHVGDEALLKALVSQQDKELGHKALQDLGPAVQWLGEKTGQNDRVIGSTLAMRVGSQRYALTVAIDYSADPLAIQDIITGIAQYLLEASTPETDSF